MARNPRPTASGRPRRAWAASVAPSPPKTAGSKDIAPWQMMARRCLAEIVGTWLMVTIGTGVVAAAVVSGAQVGLWQVAVVWGGGVTLAIYVTGAVSGAHLNPAVSLAFAIFRRNEFPFRRLGVYWACQVAGAALAGLTVWAFYRSMIARFETAEGIVRGAPGSERSAMLFGEYFPNPGMFGTDAAAQALISPVGAAAVEGFGTAILVLVIFALIDSRNSSLAVKSLSPVFIGATVAVIISVLAPLTMGGWNPARDFGPRIVAYFAGWESIAIPGPSNGFWIYIVGPLVGGPLGAAVYEFLLRPALGRDSPPAETASPEAAD